MGSTHLYIFLCTIYASQSRSWYSAKDINSTQTVVETTYTQNKLRKSQFGSVESYGWIKHTTIQKWHSTDIPGILMLTKHRQETCTRNLCKFRASNFDESSRKFLYKKLLQQNSQALKPACKFLALNKQYSNIYTKQTKAPFIATQLNSTQLNCQLSIRRRRQLSCVALDTLYDARRRRASAVLNVVTQLK